MKIGFVYSGQGAQYTGMGEDLYQQYPTYKQVVDEASALLQLDMAALCFEDSERLNETEYTQPAILTMSVALTHLLAERGIQPTIVAGLSLGEYSALVTSGAFAFEDALKLVKKRGRFMTEAVPQGKGAMSAVMGLDRETVNDCCEKASTYGVVVPANYNMPGQIAIAGEVEAVNQATMLLQEAGAKRVISLKVSGPFHTELLAPAAEQLEKELKKVALYDMNMPVVTNVSGEIIDKKEAIVPTLVKQVKSPVYWEECVQQMIAYGVDTFIEVGPGKTLRNFIKKIDKNVTAFHVENSATLEKVIRTLETE